MKTIEEAANDYVKNEYEEFTLLDIIREDTSIKYLSRDFIAGAEFAQRWISVDEKPDTPKQDEEGISYSDWLLFKVEGFEYPFIGYYVKANDDDFFDIYPEVSFQDHE